MAARVSIVPKLLVTEPRCGRRSEIAGMCPDCVFFFGKMEGVAAKHETTHINTPISHRCSKFCGGSKVKLLLIDPDSL
jgi:NAD-dependent dihydropyrimidine dehydrogenase PreA subunit